jgi:hypothetical protein
MTDSDSIVERMNYRGKETATHLLTADNLSIREAPDGTLVVELFDYGANGVPLHGYKWTLGPEDRARLKHKI